MFCKHKWKKIGMPRHLKYDYSGNEVVVIFCQCENAESDKIECFMDILLETYLTGR